MLLLRRLHRRRPAVEAHAAFPYRHRYMSSGPCSASGIYRFTLARCPFLLLELKPCPVPANWGSLQDVVHAGIALEPEALRRFWRATQLTPPDVLDIFAAFGTHPGLKRSFFLYNVYNWAESQNPCFRHLAETKIAMITILMNAQMLENAEELLVQFSDGGDVASDTLSTNVLYNEIIKRYAEGGDAKRSIALYNRARREPLFVPSEACYGVMLRLLIDKKWTDEALEMYTDMMETGSVHVSDESFIDFVVNALIKIDRVVEAITVIWKLKSSGLDIPTRVLSTVAVEFCRKKDYSDMMHFLEEWHHVPDAHICNMIVSRICVNLGAEAAWSFVQRTEALGFVPDSITLGVLISYSCKERKLKDALLFLSECFSRGIRPKACFYNALVAGLFKEELYRHVKFVVEDMVEQGLALELTTYKILLAGYCRHKKFDEVESILGDIEKKCIASPVQWDCALNKALKILDLTHLEVKIKRDNTDGFHEADFFDSVGNGLYLQTDVKKYEGTLDEILDNAIFPDLSSSLVSAFQEGSLDKALQLKDEARQWGLSISSTAYSELLKFSGEDPEHTSEILSLVECVTDWQNQLDADSLNFLVQKLSKNGMSSKARVILAVLARRELPVAGLSYTNTMLGFCREKNISGFWDCWNLAYKGGWLPGKIEIKSIVDCICKWGVFEEALKLLDAVVQLNLWLFYDAYYVLLEQLCETGQTSVGCATVEAVLEKGLHLDKTVYQYIMKGFIKEQRTLEASVIAEIWLDESTVQPPDICSSVLPLFLKYHRFERAVSLIQPAMNKLIAGSPICNKMLQQLCRLGELQKNSFLFHKIVEENIMDCDILSSLSEGFCQGGYGLHVLKILCYMLRRHVGPSVAVFRCIVQQMCREHQFARAWPFMEMIHNNSNSTVYLKYNILIFTLLQDGNILLVERILEDMRNRDIAPDKDTYDFLVYGYQKCGSPDRSVSALYDCIRNGFTPRRRSLRTVMWHYCTQGNTEKALDLYHLMEQNGWEHDKVIQTMLGITLLSSSQYSEAQFLIEKIRARDICSSDVDFNLLIKHFCLHGHVDTAIDLLNTMMKRGCPPSSACHSFVIRRLCAQQLFDRALDFLSEMQFQKLEPSQESCNALIFGLCNVSRITEARRVLQTMMNLEVVPSSEMYMLVIDKYSSCGNMQEAAELLREMQQNGHTPKFDSHWSVISNLSANLKPRRDKKPILSTLLSWSDLPLNSKNTSNFIVK